MLPSPALMAGGAQQLAAHTARVHNTDGCDL